MQNGPYKWFKASPEAVWALAYRFILQAITLQATAKHTLAALSLIYIELSSDLTANPTFSKVYGFAMYCPAPSL